MGETDGLFENRQIDYEPVELTSRVSTARTADNSSFLTVSGSSNARLVKTAWLCRIWRRTIRRRWNCITGWKR